MKKNAIVLSTDELVIALQALRAFGDQLEAACRYRRARDPRLHEAQRVAGAVLTRLSEAYVRAEP